MEILKIILGRERSLMSKQGIKEATGESPVVDYVNISGKRTRLTGKPLWADAIHGPIVGRIPGNTVGLIDSVHSSIALTIGKPSSPELGNTAEVKLDDYQQIGTKFALNESQRLGGDWADASRNAKDLTSQIVTLNENIANLAVDRAGEAKKLLSEALKTQERLKTEETRALQRLQEFQSSHFPNPGAPLTIQSLNGNITLDIEDPEVGVVISDNYSHREEAPRIQGEPPKDSKRVIRVFTYRGKISINYPQRIIDALK